MIEWITLKQFNSYQRNRYPKGSFITFNGQDYLCMIIAERVKVKSLSTLDIALRFLKHG